jgi:hypothetical protein
MTGVYKERHEKSRKAEVFEEGETEGRGTEGRGKREERERKEGEVSRFCWMPPIKSLAIRSGGVGAGTRNIYIHTQTEQVINPYT